MNQRKKLKLHKEQLSIENQKLIESLPNWSKDSITKALPAIFPFVLDFFILRLPIKNKLLKYIGGYILRSSALTIQNYSKK